MSQIFNTVIYEPIFNAVVFLYNIIPGSDFGLAIIFLTVLIRVLFLPLTIKTMRSQRALGNINPKIKAIKDKHKDDKAAQSSEILKLYKEEKVNPSAGCLSLLVQIPILIGLYKAFGAGFSSDNLSLLYPFVTNPGAINPISFGFLNITQPNHILAVLTGVAQFLQVKFNPNIPTNGPKETQIMNKQMMYMFPVIIVVVGWNLPAALMVYWITATLASIAEQVYIKRVLDRQQP